MKRLICYQAPSLDDLLTLAVAVDENKLALDPDRVRTLLTRLAEDARLKLGTSSQLRLRSACVGKDSAGNVTVRLNRSGFLLRTQSAETAA